MSPILRLAPGTPVPRAGTYALVGDYGEPLGFAAWFDQGDKLPLVAVTYPGQVWFYWVDVATSSTKAA